VLPDLLPPDSGIGVFGLGFAGCSSPVTPTLAFLPARLGRKQAEIQAHSRSSGCHGPNHRGRKQAEIQAHARHWARAASALCGRIRACCAPNSAPCLLAKRTLPVGVVGLRPCPNEINRPRPRA
jgi:hypothetical protein